MIVYLKSISEVVLGITSEWNIIDLDNINIFQRPILIDNIKNYNIICSNDGINIDYDLRNSVINYLLGV